MSQRRTAAAALTALLTAILSLLYIAVVRADSPPNPLANIPWQWQGGGVAEVEAAYNHARRAEEQQLGFPSGTLGILELPTQAVWDILSDPAKALLLMNAERLARGGSRSDVLGLGFTAVQANVQDLAEKYAALLVSKNQFSHEADGRTPFERIDDDPLLGPCHEFLGRAENLALLGTSGDSIPLYLEQAIYAWIYTDAGSAWGHREAVLLQDRDLTHQDEAYGFDNNVPSKADEGFIGIAVIETDGRYNPLGWPDMNYTVLLVMEMIDPLPAEGCPWSAMPTTEPEPTSTPQPTTTPTPTDTLATPATAAPTDTPTITPSPPATPTPGPVTATPTRVSPPSPGFYAYTPLVRG